MFTIPETPRQAIPFADTPQPRNPQLPAIPSCDARPTDTSGAACHTILVADERDARTIRELIPDALVMTFGELIEADDAKVKEAADLRSIVAILPAKAGPATLGRLGDALDRVRGIADEILVGEWPGWIEGTPFSPPAGCDTQGALLLWLRSLAVSGAPHEGGFVSFVSTPDQESARNGAPEGGFVSFVSTPGGGIPVFSGPPRPIVTTLRPVPEFNPELLPTPLRAWVVDIADRMQCAIEYPAIAAIITLATVIGRKMAIRPKQFDSWEVIANLWGMIVGRPGVLKSPALVEAMRPLNRLIAEARERHAEAIARHIRCLMIAGAKRDGARDNLKKAAKGGKSDEELERLAALATADDGGDEPILKRYQTSDTTVPKLGELLRDNPAGILIYRDELQGFLRSLDKQGSEADRAFYLEGWNGNGSFDYDRIERGHIHIDAVCLSILGGIQPGPLAAYLKTALSGAGDDGLISRFQLAVYPDQDREFRIVDRAPDAGAKNRAFDVIRAIDSLNPIDLGCELGEEKGGVPYIRFYKDAQILFYEWLTSLQREKLSGDEPEAMESHLAKYRSLMPALALVFHVVDAVDGGTGGPVSLDAARRSAAWCHVLEEHARRIHQAAGDGDMGPARGLAEKLSQSLPNPFKARDVIRKQWSGLTTNDEVEHALGILEEYDWVRPVDAAPGPKGGRPTVEYHVNPSVGGGA